MQFQIISATRNTPGQHGTHIRGVAAILSNENSPFSRHPLQEMNRVAEFPFSQDTHPPTVLMVSKC